MTPGGYRILNPQLRATPFAAMLLVAGLCFTPLAAPGAVVTKAKLRSMDEWRALTATNTAPPRVFVKGHRVRFFFQRGDTVTGFSAKWDRHRIPADGYAASSAVLRWDEGLTRLPENQRGWREATVIAGAAWRRYATNLIDALTPQTPWHGVYYQAFLADRVLYRDSQGVPHIRPQGDQPAQVVIDRRHPMEETLQVLGALAEKYRAEAHPNESLFVFMAPNGGRVSQPLLVDEKNRECVNLLPEALLGATDRGPGFAATLKGLGALVESHTLPLIKNPVSSVARLADLGVETAAVVLHLRVPRSSSFPALTETNGMDLVAWEKWLDQYTGTRPEDGSLELLIDGDRFFTRLQQAICAATNRIAINLFIFDTDDVAVAIADELKQRSEDVRVKVIVDRMGTLTAGLSPPDSPMPLDFEPPDSIIKYLRQDSRVHVRSFLNPWFSVDHTKVFIADGSRAWVGGMNLGREYRYEWHDLMFELQGPVVASLENEFNRDWAHAGPLGDLAFVGAALRQPLGAKSTTTNGWIKVRRLPTRTAWKPFNSAVQASIRKARNHIYIENPYLFDKRVITGLVQARKRGVDVRVILPRVNDFKAGARGNVVTANYLLEHGVRVYFYPGMTHVKAMLVDGWSCLGSGNLSHYSLRVGQEQNIATSDPAFAARLRQELFEEDFSRSFELKQPISSDWVDFLADLLLEGL